MPEPTPDLAAIVEEADVWVADYHSQATLSEKGIALKGLGAVLVVDWPTIRAALERTAELEAALRELNSAIWTDYPQWAIASPETYRATMLLGGPADQPEDSEGG